MAFGNGYQRRYWQECLGDKVRLEDIYPKQKEVIPTNINIVHFPHAKVKKKIMLEEYDRMCRAGMLRQCGATEEQIVETMKHPPRYVMTQEEARAWQANVAADELRRGPSEKRHDVWDTLDED